MIDTKSIPLSDAGAAIVAAWEATNKHVTRPLVERFWSQVQIGQPDDCWLWNGGVSGTGYGGFSISRRIGTLNAHRVSFVIVNGDIPKGLQVCHKCDVRRCVNPNHLFLGTARDNAVDRTNKDRGARGERSGVSKLTESDVSAIRRLVASGATKLSIASRYGISVRHVYYIRDRQFWRRQDVV